MSQNEENNIENFIDKGIDITNRTIYFGSTEYQNVNTTDNDETYQEISFTNVLHVIKAIKYFENNYLKNFSCNPITIQMYSGGGDMYIMFALIDIVETCKCKVIFKGYGLVASAAVLLMAVCDERILAPNTRILIHGTNLQVNQSTNIIAQNETQYLEDKGNEILAKNSYVRKKFFDDIGKSGRDLWLSAEETIQLGLADKLLETTDRSSFRQRKTQTIDESILTKMINKIYL